MNALLADTPPAAPVEAQGTPPQGQALAPSGGEGQPTGAVRACPNCAAAMAPGQDWCMHCGAATPGSVGASAWRPAAGIIAVTVALVLGAAAAGVAALSKKSSPTPVVTTTVARAPTPAATPPLTTPSTPSTVAPLPKPPTIPLKAVTPKPATTPTTPSTTKTTEASEKAAKEKVGATGKTGGSGTETEPEPILLDTNAAQTYDPYAYPAAYFGDPSLAIDGDSSTGWSAQVNPATAPLLAEGLLLDLKTPQKLSVLKLITTTPGMTVQVYGANGHTVPGSITDKAWVKLSHALTIHKHHAKIGLRNKKTAYRFLTLWISKAPQSAVGTPEAPGHVTVNEVELLPAP